jgi:hypothetical protein
MEDIRGLTSEEQKEKEATAVLSFLRKWRGGVTIRGSRPRTWDVDPTSARQQPVTAIIISNQQFATLTSNMAQEDSRLSRLASLAQKRVEDDLHGGLNEREILKYGKVLRQVEPHIYHMMNLLAGLARSGELQKVLSGADSSMCDDAIQQRIEGELGMMFARGAIVSTASRRDGKVLDIFAEKRLYLVDWGNEKGWVKESDLQRPLKKTASSKKYDFRGIVPTTMKRTASIPTRGMDESVEAQVRRMLSIFRFPDYMKLTYSGMKKTEYDTKTGALMRGVLGFMLESNTPMGVKLRLEIPVPVIGGRVGMPTQFKMGNKMLPLNQETLNAVFSGYDTTRPMDLNIMSPNNIRVEYPQFKTNVFQHQRG